MKSLTVSTKEAQKLLTYAIEKNIKRAKPTNQYELFRIKDGPIFIVAYKTGKLVHNDSDETKRLLDQIMAQEEEFDYVVGTDETGKGEWYGPLVIVGVALTPKEIVALRKMGIQDSKSLSKDRIRELGKYIRMSSLIFDSRVLKPQSYNKMYEDFKKEGKNLNDILAWAHTAIINDILQKIAFNKAKVVIDKFDIKATDLRLGKVKKMGVQVIQKSRGESETPVAAASIVAKLLYEDEVDFLNKKYGVDLRRSQPEDIAKDVLEQVSKTHFKNVNEVLKKK
jgi:ribonuclease HIII